MLRPALLVCLLLGQPSWADEGTLKACHEEWEPYAYHTADGQTRGITAELLTEALRRLGYRLSFTETSYARCKREVEVGSMDIALFANHDEAPALLHTTVSTEYWIVSAWVAETSPLRSYTGLQAFRGATVGMPLGYSWPEPLASFKDWTRIDSSDPRKNLRLLTSGRVDAVFDDAVWGNRVRAQEHLPIRLLHPPIVVEPQFALFNPRHRELVAKLDAMLRKMQRHGDFDQVYRRHTGANMHSWIHSAD